MVTKQIAPVVREVEVSCSPEDAFRIFTEQIGSWWPAATHSIGGESVAAVTMECRAGGRVYETLTDGTTYSWGTITGWEPPRGFGMNWSPSPEPRPLTQVEVRFEAIPGGTRVELTHTGWEHLGEDADRMRDNYSTGWATVLDKFVRGAKAEATK
jgi:Activator of Hsp90 ATPase homolog 1-like protein